MEPKKISFGFNKVIKKQNLIPNKSKDNSENKIELIQCLEEQSIKLVNPVEFNEAPLVIPMKENTKTSAALASLRLRQEVLNGAVVSSNDENKILLKYVQPIGNESIEQKAIRELLKESLGENTEETEPSNLALPVKADELPLDGASEPTIEDYENIPITQFGLAMLRGMGWKDEIKPKSPKDLEGPILRPKGMGLGADKVLKRKPLVIPPEKNEKLEIKKNACVRILGGKYKDMYGQIEGLDDHAGRVIVKMALGGNRESLNEFMVQPVSKAEYAQYGKVINSAKYEEYKKMETEHRQIKTENIKIENDSSKEDERKYNKNELNKNDSRVQHSSLERLSSKRGYVREDNDRDLEIKLENRDRKVEKSSTSRSENKYDEYRRQHKSSSSRRDHQSRRQSTSTESTDSEDYRKSKKKSKKKNKDHQKHHHDSAEDDKRHKKKTKKSKKPRSRSRERR